MGLSRYTGLQGTIKPTDTRENSCFFCVCVNLIIQIFIYTVRKNLLIFISSQAPRGPTTNTHPACLLHTTVQVEAAIAAPAFTQGNKGKERQGGVEDLLAFLSPGNPTILSCWGSDLIWGGVYSHAHFPPWPPSGHTSCLA